MIPRVTGHQIRGQRLSHAHTWLQTEATLFSESCLLSSAGKMWVCITIFSFAKASKVHYVARWRKTSRVKGQNNRAQGISHIHICLYLETTKFSESCLLSIVVGRSLCCPLQRTTTSPKCVAMLITYNTVWPPFTGKYGHWQSLAANMVACDSYNLVASDHKEPLATFSHKMGAPAIARVNESYP